MKLDFTPTKPTGKLRLDFRPRCYMRDRTHSYLWIRDGYKFGHFLTMDSGSIELVKIDIVDIEIEPEVKADKKAKIAAKPAVIENAYRVFETREKFSDLTPHHPYDFLKAVGIYHSSTLGRSAAAEREMRALLGLPPLADTVTDADLEASPQTGRKATERAHREAAGYTLQALCLELKLDPTEARKTLRSKKIEKPGARWEWATKEAAAAVIAALGA